MDIGAVVASEDSLFSGHLITAKGIVKQRGGIKKTSLMREIIGQMSPKTWN